MLTLTVILSIAASACGKTSTPSATTTNGAGSPSLEEVTFGAQLGQIRGHHFVALALYRAGDKPHAAVHLGHPIDEILASVQGEIAEHDADASNALKPALEAALAVVGRSESADLLATAVREAGNVVDRAEAAVVGAKRTSVAYRASVIASLLATAGDEYEEAVKDGAIAEEIEYQDAYAFASIAAQSYEGIEAEVKKAGAEEAEEIAEAFETLGKALPGPTPPATPLSVEAVERAGAQIGHELEESVAALPAKKGEPKEAFDTIETLLGQILAEYEKGERDEAAEIAAKAYLESYELVEAEVIRLAPEVNKELEPILGAELRAKIKQGVPVAELRALIEKARQLLAKAREAVVTS